MCVHHRQTRLKAWTLYDAKHGLLQNLDMAELVERVRTAVVARAAQLLRKDPDAPVDYLTVDLPCTFFMLRTLRCQDQAPGCQPALYLLHVVHAKCRLPATCKYC